MSEGPLRAFVAVLLPDSLRALLAAKGRELRADTTGVKWVEPENLHITLLFLGEVEQRETLDICRTAQKAVATLPAFVMSIEGAGAFPNPRRPRTLWVGVGAGSEEVGTLHDAIEAPLLEMGSYRRETRAYVPHVTLGRVTGERSDDDELAKLLATHKTWSAGEVTVREVQVMRSELASDGPTYTVLGRAKLLSK
jgi:2'-5' RNA ligase